MAEFEAQAEEQAMEAEALESIFAEDFEQVGEAPFVWRVKLTPHPPGEAEENHVGITLQCTLPPAYPETVPTLAVEVDKGLSEAQRSEAEALAVEKAEENVGMSMVYTLVEELREWLLARNEPASDNSMHSTMLKRMQEQEKAAEAARVEEELANRDEIEIAEQERNRQKQLEGTPVNPETFAAWNAAFRAEMDRDRPFAVADGTGSVKKTGRQYFSGATQEEMAQALEAENRQTAEADAEAAEAMPEPGEGGGGGAGGGVAVNSMAFIEGEEEADLEGLDLSDSEEEEGEGVLS